jgi:hypothetical protein
MRIMGWVGSAVLAGWLGCGPSLEDSIDKLGGSPEEQAAGRMALLLAKDRAVDDLLQALDDPERATSRRGLVEVLVGLMNRVDDERIEVAVLRVLRDDPDYRVRATVAQQLGLHRPAHFIEPFLGALADTSGAVCHAALLALGKVESDLDAGQRERLQQGARRLTAHGHHGARLEATIRVENFVSGWIEEARQAELGARLALAESLYTRALDYSPRSKRGNYRLARYYFDNGERARGLARLQAHGMMLEVPRLSQAPKLDGQLDEPVWQEAAQVDSFFQHSTGHFAAIPSPQRTRIYLGYTEAALYFGFYGYDAHPDSLVGRSRNFDAELWYEDIVELFIDPGFTRRNYIHVGINHLGTVHDAWLARGLGQRRIDWNASATAAVEVGRDFWAAEYRLDFGQDEVPKPEAGTEWGFNFVRVFRGAEYSQWVRTYHGGHQPDEFGLLVFK